jgi:hypothetical protein
MRYKNEILKAEARTDHSLKKATSILHFPGPEQEVSYSVSEVSRTWEKSCPLNSKRK